MLHSTLVAEARAGCFLGEGYVENSETQSASEREYLLPIQLQTQPGRFFKQRFQTSWFNQLLNSGLVWTNGFWNINRKVWMEPDCARRHGGVALYTLIYSIILLTWFIHHSDMQSLFFWIYAIIYFIFISFYIYRFIYPNLYHLFILFSKSKLLLLFPSFFLFKSLNSCLLLIIHLPAPHKKGIVLGKFSLTWMTHLTWHTIHS